MPTIRVDVPGDARGYDVIVEPGALNGLAELLKEHAPAHRYILVTDSNVNRLHAGRVLTQLHEQGLLADPIEFPAGEASKSPETWTRVVERMAELGAGRDACVIALGGGVVGDLAGFAAATYARGVPFVQVPTTLLAMVDAAVGGKTGLDLPAGKNLVGAFHWPRVVLCDPVVLATLPESNIREGLAEAVKHGAIADAEYARTLAREAPALIAKDPAALARAVARSVEIKAEVVAEDPLESGRRATLNFGHTVAHALERLSGYALPHGEAVAIGMAAEARLGEALGISEPGTHAELVTLLRALGLPATLPGDVAPAAIPAAAATDKKARAGRTRYALLARLGEAARGPDGAWTVAVDSGGVVAALASPETA